MSTSTPDSHTAIPPDVRARLEEALNEAAAGRERQLEDLPPPSDGDTTPNSVLRNTAERLLTEIRAAQKRLTDGTFGSCQKCGAAIPFERLELRPWASLCVRCADR